MTAWGIEEGGVVRFYAHAERGENIKMGIQARDEDYFRCRWVPAHTASTQVGEEINETDRELNHGADQLAVEAAKQQAPPTRMVLAAKHRKKIASVIQRTAVDILVLRSAAIPCAQSSAYNELKEARKQNDEYTVVMPSFKIGSSLQAEQYLRKVI